jgi:hypothetical protein
MPYCTLDDRIDGVVITFADITTSKNLEAKLRDQQSSLEKRLAEQPAKTSARTAPGATRRKPASDGANKRYSRNK